MSAPATSKKSFACGDFPTWMPAVLVKELRQGLHTGGFVGMLLLFHAVMVVAMTTTVVALPGATAAARANAASISDQFFWTLLGVMLLAVLPARADRQLPPAARHLERDGGADAGRRSGDDGRADFGGHHSDKIDTPATPGAP